MKKMSYAAWHLNIDNNKKDFLNTKSELFMMNYVTLTTSNGCWKVNFASQE